MSDIQGRQGVERAQLCIHGHSYSSPTLRKAVNRYFLLSPEAVSMAEGRETQPSFDRSPPTCMLT